MYKKLTYLVCFVVLVLAVCVPADAATSVTVENFSFEIPGTEKIKGWDGACADSGWTGLVYDIPGWSSDTVASDSGVETDWSPSDGTWSGFIMGSDPSVWQLADHVILSGAVYTLTVDAENNYAATQLVMTLYYDVDGTREVGATVTIDLTDADYAGQKQEYTLTFSAADVPAAAGHYLGIEFDNPAGGWAGFDNVRLEYEGGANTTASGPSPGNMATDVPRDIVLGWTAGAFADKHDVYVGTDFNDVNDANLAGLLDYSTDQSENYFPTSGYLDLDFSQTYYWKVDEVNDACAPGLWEGEVWQFTTEPYAYPLPSDRIDANASSEYNTVRIAENTINGSGLNDNDEHSNVMADMWLSASEPTGAWIQYDFDNIYKLHEMWVWNFNDEFNHNFGLRNVNIQYSTDGLVWTPLGSYEFTEGSGEPNYAHETTIDMSNILAKHIRLNATTNWGGSYYGLSEVRFYYIPMRAREPDPSDEQPNVPIDVTLEWRAGREAAQHKLYISTDEQAVTDETVTPNTIAASGSYGSYGPLDLELGATYYWKVNEVNSAETPSEWEGDVWQFSTPEYLVVDDMDDYGDANTPGEPGSRIYYVWRDGWGVTDPPLPGNNTGSQVYHWNDEGTGFMETTIVRSSKSMPFYYENDGDAQSKPVGTYSQSGLDYYSEATANTADLAIGTNWNKGGAKSLVIWFYGDPDNDANATEQMYVKLNGEKITYNGDMNDIKEPYWHEWNIELTDFGINSISLGFGNGTPGGKGIVYFDDIRLYPPRCVPSFISPDGDLDNDCDADYDDLGIMAGRWLDTDSSSDPLVAWYKLDDGSGTTAADSSSAYDNDGTLVGVPEWVSGHINGGLDFNGVSDYVDCSNDVSLDITDAVTLTAWVDTNDCNNGEHNPYVGKGDSSYAIKHHTSNSIQFFIYDGTWYTVNCLIDDSFNDEWHHVAGTYDGMQLKLYVDGILSGVTNHIGSISTNTYNVNIGRNSEATDRFYEGLIDDVRIYDKALSQAEIVSIMDGTSGSVSNYHPITSPAELYDSEAQGSRKIDFKDFAVMAADSWLEDPLLWP